MPDSEYRGDRMDEFFDNLLNDDQRRQFLDERKDDEDFVHDRELQTRINQAIRDRFSIHIGDEGDVLEQRLAVHSGRTASSFLNRRTAIISMAATVGALLIYGVANMLVQDREPYFASQSLARLYQQEISRGFQPYYECHDMERFERTFEHRLNQSLTLSEMPDDRSMLGISYLGGLSRRTVAMLCQVKGEPVVVFVDRADQRNDELAAVADDSGLSVFSSQHQGIVFYEVTPFREPAMMEYFVFLD